MKANPPNPYSPQRLASTMSLATSLGASISLVTQAISELDISPSLELNSTPYYDLAAQTRIGAWLHARRHPPIT